MITIEYFDNYCGAKLGGLTFRVPKPIGETIDVMNSRIKNYQAQITELKKMTRDACAIGQRYIDRTLQLEVSLDAAIDVLKSHGIDCDVLKKPLPPVEVKP